MQKYFTSSSVFRSLWQRMKTGFVIVSEILFKIKCIKTGDLVAKGCLVSSSLNPKFNLQ